MNTRKKQYKLNFIISILAIVFFICIILLYYRMLYMEKKANIIRDGEITARASADLIDQYVSPFIDSVSLAAYALDEMVTKNRSNEDIQDFLVRQSVATKSAVEEDFTGFYAHINGRFFSGVNWVAPEGYDSTTRPWYQKPLKHPGQITLLDPYLDLETNRYKLAVGKLLCDGVSVVSMDMTFEEIQAIVEEAVSSGDADVCFVISEDNLVIAHTDLSEVGRDYDVQIGTLGETIVRNLDATKDDYYFEFEYQNSNYIVYAATLQCGLRSIYVKNVSRVFSSMKWILFSTILVVIMGVLLIAFISSHFSKAAEESTPEAAADSKEPASPLQEKKKAKEPIAVPPKKPSKASRFFDVFGAKKETHLSTRIQRLVLLILVVSESIFCIATIVQSRAAIKSSVNQRMIDIANCAAGSVDGNIHKSLTVDDIGTPEYMEIYNALSIFRDNVELEYVYAIKIEDDGRFTFSVDPDITDPAEFGRKLETTKGLLEARSGVPSVDEFETTDKWGTFYSAYSPIIDSDGNVAGLVGVDFSTEWYQNQLNAQTKTVVLIYVIILAITIALTWVLCYIWIRSITEPLRYMTEVAMHYGEGDFSETIETDSKDEIGVLSHTLQVMSGSLQEQIHRAEAANKAKSTFLANMSHEIRTPINAVLGMNEMILQESKDKTILYYAQNIKSAGRCLLNLINDVLDFSKIEAGKTVLAPADYALAGLLDDLLIMTQSRAHDKGLEFNITVNPDIPRILFGDEGRIRQVTTNLLSNAVKYTKEGSISFNVDYKMSGENPDSIYLLVSVSDTGIGIKEEDLPKIFDKFERFDVSKNRNIEGTGLGLSITQNLLELMESTLKVESEYGKGSVFSYELKQKVVDWEPIGVYESFSKNNLAAGEKSHVSFTAPTAQILAVDDSPMNLVVINNLLKHTKVQVNTAESGFEGLRLSREKKYDLIFLDHMMPEKDGIETLKDIRSDEKNENNKTPIICLTANAISGAKERYLAEGFDGYLSKPIDIYLLEESLLEFLPKDKVEIGSEKDVSENGDAADSEASGQEAALLNSLRSSNIIDVEAGIRNNGDQGAFISILKMYAVGAYSRASQLNNLYKEGDIANYAILIHAIKSSSRIIGAAPLGEDAQQLENAAKAEDMAFLDAHHQEFLTSFGKLKDGLLKILEETGMLEDTLDASPDKPKADTATMDRYYSYIQAAAEDMDSDRLDELFKEMEGYSIPEKETVLYNTIKEAADNFDYDTVIKALTER